MNTSKSERKRIRNRRKRFLNENNSNVTSTVAKYHPRKFKKTTKANNTVTETVGNETDNNATASEEFTCENVDNCVELDVQELISDGEIIVRTEPIQFVLDPNDVHFNATIVATADLQEYEERSVINDGSNEVSLTLRICRNDAYFECSLQLMFFGYRSFWVATYRYLEIVSSYHTIVKQIQTKQPMMTS